MACNVTLPNTAATLVKFQLTCLFSPVLTTIAHALAALIMPAFPGLTLKALHKCGSPSIHTQKGHMDQARVNQASTSQVEELEHFFPKMFSDNETEHCCFAAITTAPTKTGNSNAAFSDQTGKFPFKSLFGNQHIFVFYHDNSSYIHLEPMKNKSQVELLLVRACSETLKMFISAGTKSSIHILDKQCPQSLKDYMLVAGVNYQLTPPGTHRYNFAEQSIRTANAHTISGLSSVHPCFPMHQWDQLIPQAEITLNLLRGSRMNPKLSACTQINGIFGPLATPLGPPGCLVLAHKKPSKRTTWVPHRKEGFCIGPDLELHHCFRVDIPETQAIRSVDTLSLFPHDFQIPALSINDILYQATQDTLQVLQNTDTYCSLTLCTPQELTAIKDLVSILHKKLPNPDLLPPPPPPPQEKVIAALQTEGCPQMIKPV